MFKLLNSEKLILGIDISDTYTQLNYCTLEEPEKTETLSVTAGGEKFNIPTVLCKKPKVNQWFVGKEALKLSEENGGILIKNLLELARTKEEVNVEGAMVSPDTLLSIFLKKCVAILMKLRQSDRLEAVMFTLKQPDKNQKEALMKAAEGLKIKEDKIFFQSHSESFYCYMLSQEEELWSASTILFEYDNGTIRQKKLECNRDRSPAVVYIDEKEYPFTAYSVADGAENLRAGLERMDAEFLKVCKENVEKEDISSVYLIGEEFSTEWMSQSLKYLCKRRRVFQGSNLFGKGACYGLAKKLVRGEEDENYVFMGGDKLKSNIGMKLLDRGEEIYFSVFDAGISWYDADRFLEVYIQDGNQIDIMITSIIGKGNKLAQIILEDLTGGIRRLKIHMHLTDVEHLTVEIEDMGLGTMCPGSHNIWKEEIMI